MQVTSNFSKSEEGFMVYIEKSIYGLVQTRIYFGAVWQKIGIGPQHLVELSL